MLSNFNLITQDIDFINHYYIGLPSCQCYAAAGGLEFHFPYALVRSVVVLPRYQRRGYARIICNALSARAIRNNIEELYLLTESAQGFFEKVGFAAVDRSNVPAPIRNTGQFSSLCPADAVIMKKQLIP